MTLDIYGAEQCLETLGEVLDPETEIAIREIGEPGPWGYVIDDITMSFNDVLPIESKNDAGAAKAQSPSKRKTTPPTAAVVLGNPPDSLQGELTVRRWPLDLKQKEGTWPIIQGWEM